MNDTICGIATGFNGSISIIRISGEESFEIVNSIFTNKFNKDEFNKIKYGYILNEDEKIDEVLVSYFKEGKSYTCEEMFEINTHANRVIVNEIISLLIKKGCRLATNGEFTKRAFYNGRIDLTEVSAIDAILNADSKTLLKSSLMQLNGNLENTIKNIEDKIKQIISLTEISIDYPEYEEFVENEQLNLNNIQNIKEIIESVKQKLKEGKILKEGINVIFIGKPNAGKSTLLNNLSKEEKAIVSDIAGTTRDFVENEIMLNDLKINVIDSAGIRNTTDEIETIGIKKTIQKMDDVDLIIALFDGSTIIDENDKMVLELVEDKKHIKLINKIDIDTKFDFEGAIKISAKENKNIEKLETEIKDFFNFRKKENFDFVFVGSLEQEQIFDEISETIKIVEDMIVNQEFEDLINLELRNILNLLERFLGIDDPENLINNMFANFCLGK